MNTRMVITVILAMLVIIVIVMMLGIAEKKKRIEKIKNTIKNRYGKRPAKMSSAQIEAASGYYKRHEQDNQIDDITFNDFSLNTLFELVNNTYSSAGEEYLYHMLRTPRYDKEYLDSLEQDIAYFMEHEEAREAVSFTLAEIGKLKGYSLYDYLESQELAVKRSQLKHILAILFVIVSVVLIFVSTGVGILCLIATFFYNIISYYSEKNDVLMYMQSLSYVVRLINASKKLMSVTKPLELPKGLLAEREKLNENVKALGKLNAGAKYIFSSTINGSVLSMLFDYINMLFHIDLITFNSMINQFYERKKNIDDLVGNIGYIESTIAIGSYRNSLDTYCRPNLGTEESEAENIYHPYGKKPVANSYKLGTGMLITGANASGKSTFLRTIGINTLMAQTIHTVCADSFSSRFYRIYSSMSIADNLLKGDSYYMAEIKSLKRIVDAGNEKGPSVLCFVDEVLRGTNTIERIAASTQILKYLAGGNVVCVAATHDVELTSLLEGTYDNYHFTDNFDNGDIHFDYKLHPGKANSCNAIKLLSQMGYADEIIREAESMANTFEKTGVWK